MQMTEIIQLFKQRNNMPENTIAVEGLSPMVLKSSFADTGIQLHEIDKMSKNYPKSLIDFWNISRKAWLFEDIQYGQWGLEIFDPKESSDLTLKFSSERQRDFSHGDLIIGKFIGDSDLLLVRCDIKSIDYGNIIVALPIDPRDDWNFVEESFDVFLNNYANSNGDKYWE